MPCLKTSLMYRRLDYQLLNKSPAMPRIVSGVAPLPAPAQPSIFQLAAFDWLQCDGTICVEAHDVGITRNDTILIIGD